jgi:hypothetical protein
MDEQAFPVEEDRPGSGFGPYSMATTGYLVLKLVNFFV